MREPGLSHSLPLDGVHVVDFGHWVAGPFAAEILADLGATVIKVEPFGGDPLSRSLPGPYGVANRGKLSLAANLKAPGAQEVVRRLVLWSDVVTSNYRPGVAERLGFSPDQVKDIDPSVAVLETTAYGTDGPSSNRPGFDPIFLALSGAAYLAGGSEGPPVCGTRLGPVDSGTGMLGAFAALTALYRSRRTGVGGSVAVSLLNTSLFMMGEIERKPDGSLVGAATLDRDRTGSHPAQALYQLEDGWVAIVATQESAICSFASALGLNTLASRPPKSWGQAEHDAITAVLRDLSRRELECRLAGIEVSVVPCASDSKTRTLSNPHLIDAGLIAPANDTGSAAFVGFPVHFTPTREAAPYRTHVPTPGEHTDIALQKVGFTDEEITALNEVGIVRRNSTSASEHPIGSGHTGEGTKDFHTTRIPTVQDVERWRALPQLNMASENDDVTDFNKWLDDVTESTRMRFGSDDRLGTANYIDPNAILRAVKSVEIGEAVTLARPIVEGPGFRVNATFDAAGLCGVDTIESSCHGYDKTHMDALNHLSRDGVFYGGRSLRDAALPTVADLAAQCLLTRAVFADITAVRGTPWVFADEPVTDSDIEAALDGIQVLPGDALVLYMGRDRWESSGQMFGREAGDAHKIGAYYPRKRPGAGRRAARWVVENQISMVAWDFLDGVDDPNLPDEAKGSLHRLLPTAGLVLIDNCDMAAAVALMSRHDRRTGAIAALPLPIPSGTGSIVNPWLLC